MNKNLKKISLYFIFLFLIFTTLYNGISTFVNFGLNLNVSPSLIAGIRDGGWFIFTIVLILTNIKKSIKIIRKTFFLMFFLVGFSIFGFLLSYFHHGQSVYEIIVGFKSTVLPFFILLSAIICGELIFSQQCDKNITLEKGKTQKINNKIKYSNKLQKIIKTILRIILIGGIFRQLGKILFPDFFYAIGYGPIGDRHFNQNPPLYYRTGPGGWMRFSGFFAGPNNYGYFLTLLFPYIIYIILNTKKTSKKDFFCFTSFYLFILFILSGILTLGRGVIIGRGLQIILFLPTIRNQYKHIFQKYKKIIVGLGILSVFFFVLLSYKKIGSTIEHFDKRNEGRNYISQKPILGYGRGTSGPAFHLGGDIIPENFYFQLRIDLGIFGLIGWIILGILIFKKYYKYDHKKLFFGLFGLFFVGLFLHIREDSMVNDLFFIIFGLLLGYNIPNKNLKKSTK